MEDSDNVQREQFDEIVALAKTDAKKAIKAFESILNESKEPTDEEGISKYQEWAIFHLCKLYAKEQDTQALVKLLGNVRPQFVNMPKAKTAKIVRSVIDSLSTVKGAEEIQINLCKEYIEWCKVEKRAFLRQRIQARLAGLFLAKSMFQDALKLLAELQREVKRLDDKQLLVEIFLVESRVHHQLSNVPKAKSSLTAARSVANSIYVGPLLQGEIDMQGGIINAEEKDFRTSFSYFLEAFESFLTLEDPRAKICLKYMLLTKLMNEQAYEVPGILNGKKTIGFASDPEVKAMAAIAKTSEDRALDKFEAVLEEYKEIIQGDEVVEGHLKDLKASLLEANLMKIIEPYSRVEIAHVAKMIDLPVATVENTLQRMVLDKKLLGILDQGTGQVLLFDEPLTDATYDASLDTLQNMNLVVSSLFRRAENLV